MSASLLYLWLKWTFGLLIGLGLSYELTLMVGRYFKRLASKDAPIYIEGAPFKDDRDSITAFHKMYPRRER